MAVEVKGNGTKGNGHHDPIGIGPTFELAPGSGHTPVDGNGKNGHHDDEAPAPQRTLLSWMEFMAEQPVKRKRRKLKTQPATLSMFKWALTFEQER